MSHNVSFYYYGIGLSLDATDISGEQHINIEHNIFKHRLNDNGDPIDSPTKDNSKQIIRYCLTSIVIV